MEGMPPFVIAEYSGPTSLGERIQAEFPEARVVKTLNTVNAEVMVDPMMSVWDAAALQPILEEAGGTFTDWQGRPTIHSGEGIATNGKVLEEVLTITRS